MDSFSPTALVLDEMADLALYQQFRRRVSQPVLIQLFDRLISEEKKHVAFWRKKTDNPPAKLDFLRAAKVAVLSSFGSVFGTPGILLVVEAIEVHGIRKYLHLWSSTPESSVRADVMAILKDELQHEDHIITLVAGRNVRPEVIRNVFLGFNDGSVEILGAVSGFAVAFGDTTHVLIAGFTVAMAGALSMAVGAFMATSAEREVAALDELRARALSIKKEEEEAGAFASPLKAACIVGVAYLVGALVPIFPFLFGARNALPSILLSGALILAVSATLAFLSGMRVRRRLLINGGLITFAVLVSTLFGLLLERWNS